jgi:hypothetical protein
MSGARGDKYIIERDERDLGGKLHRIALYDNWIAAKHAWQVTGPDEEPDIVYWLCRLREGIDDPAHCDVIESKEGT